jgi:sigma-B regulation protein RsbU (phosphoserine phosphatase)
LLDASSVARGNLPLGLDEDSPYSQFTVTLGRGDLLCFYTDALTEAADPSGRMLGEEGLLEIARGLQLREPDRVAPALLAAVDHYRGGRPAEDDMTFLMLSHNATGPRPPSISEKLEVYAKVFGLKAF